MMLSGVARYVLVGHSERRAAGESDEQIARKVSAAAAAGLTPILFAGEDEPGAGARAQTEHRLTQGISRIDLGRQAVLVVYEPAWAIGADRAAEAGYVEEMVAALKDILRRRGASDPEVLYGGTVRKENIEQFTRIDVLDGVGATRAALDTPGFLAMVDRMMPRD